jgi:predicted  nucleic acid-binding Zn-ribbon protein
MDANLLVKVADNLFAMPDFTKVKEEHEKLKKENKELKAQIKIKDECLEFINNQEEQSEELCDIIEKLKENKELQDKLDFIKKVKEDYFKTIKWKNDMIVDLENDKRSLLKKIQRLEQTISNHEEDMKYFSKKD